MANEASSCSLPELLAVTEKEYAGHPAVIFQGRTLDFRTMGRASDAIAAGLARRGIRKGDRVAVYCPNSDAFAISYCGIVKAGAVVVPIHLLLNPKEIAYVLQDSGARAMFHAEVLGEAVAAIRPMAPSVSLWITIGAGPPLDGGTSWQEIQAEGGPPPAVDLDPEEDLAAILYTSGTTGRPKGAMLTHRNLVSNTFSIREAMRLRPGNEILIVVLPMFHSFAATVGMLFPLLHGCTFVPIPRFDPEGVARAIEATGATVFLGVPSMYATFLRLPDDHVQKLACLRLCVSGGAALPIDVLEKFETKFGKLIYEGDGPTECSPVTCVNPIGGRRKIGSVGLPVPAVEMRIVDASGEELPRREVGEICVRGPNVMKGYWNQSEETRESFFGEWFRTGDLGYEDEDGYFFIVDRKKDMIIVNGMNVYPRIIEDVLLRYAPIREAAVVGEPHRLHGEIPIACVVLREGSEVTAEQVRAFCREHLGRHEIPRKVRFLSQLPRSATGKVLKRELRTQGEYERGIEPSGDGE